MVFLGRRLSISEPFSFHFHPFFVIIMSRKGATQWGPTPPLENLNRRAVVRPHPSCKTLHPGATFQLPVPPALVPLRSCKKRRTNPPPPCRAARRHAAPNSHAPAQNEARFTQQMSQKVPKCPNFVD